MIIQFKKDQIYNNSITKPFVDFVAEKYFIVLVYSKKRKHIHLTIVDPFNGLKFASVKRNEITIIDESFPETWMQVGRDNGYIEVTSREIEYYEGRYSFLEDYFEKVKTAPELMAKLCNQLIKFHYSQLLQNKKDLAKAKYEADVKEAKERGWELPDEPYYEHMGYP